MCISRYFTYNSIWYLYNDVYIVWVKKYWKLEYFLTGDQNSLYNTEDYSPIDPPPVLPPQRPPIHDPPPAAGQRLI